MPDPDLMLDDPYAAPVRRARPIRNTLLTIIVAFVLGAVAVTWALTQWEPARRFVAPVVAVPVATEPDPVPAILPLANTPPPSAVPESVATTEARVAGLEARLAQVEARATGAAANAARAEGLLVAFAARRAVDRGAALGYIEAQLRDRFGNTQPRAVAAVIAAAQSPVTLDSLRRDLTTLTPELSGASSDENWLDSARRALGNLVTVRRKEDPPPAPDARLARAHAAIDGAQVDVAMTEIARLPSREKATNWMTSARRYVEAHRALDILEAAAVTAPQPVAPPIITTTGAQ